MIGVAHLLIGIREYGREVRGPRGLSNAGLWFLVSGASLLLFGVDIAAVPEAVRAPARRVRGFGLVGLAVVIVSQRPASGAWALLPVGAVLAYRRGEGLRPPRRSGQADA